MRTVYANTDICSMSNPRERAPSPPRKRPRTARSFPAGQGLPSGIVTRLADKLAFWFSAANLRKDRFLAHCISSNDDAWVDVDVLLTFQSIRQLGASVEDILEAATSVSTLEVDTETECSRIRLKGGAGAFRAILADEAASADEDIRTIYLSPIPRDISREELLNTFGEFSKAVQYLSMPQFPDGRTKGFCFVEFGTVSQANAFASALENRSKALVVTNWPKISAKTRAEWRALKDHRRNFQKEQKHQAMKARAQTLADEVGDSEKEKLTSLEFEPGVVVRTTVLSSSSSRQELADLFEQYGPVEDVQFDAEDPDVCFVRFMHPAAAAYALNHPRRPPGAELLTGREERKYWDRILSRR